MTIRFLNGFIEGEGRALRLALVGLFGAMAALFLVAIPPITDLPQHLSQVQAFWWAIRVKDGFYQINWLAPNSLYYFLLLGLNFFLKPMVAGKLLWVLLLGTQLWLLGAVGRRIGSSPLAVVLAGVLCLNLNFYWGLGNFVLGWCLLLAFALWGEQWPVEGRALAMLLAFLAHVFWIPVFALWEAHRIFRLEGRRGLRALGAWVLPLLPVVCMVLLWLLTDFSRKAGGRFNFQYSLWDRLSFTWFSHSALGGVQGYWEAALLLPILVGLVLGARRVGSLEGLRARMAVLGFALLGLAWVLPDAGFGVVLVSQRWVPLAVQALLLALPWPSASPWAKGLRAWAVLGVALFAVGTTRAWLAFAPRELDGLREAMAPLKAGDRVLVLDGIGEGGLFLCRATMHVGALAQVEKGCTVSNSFASIPSAFVRYQQDPGYTRTLEWIPEMLTKQDLRKAEFLLYGGRDSAQNLARFGKYLQPMGLHDRVWRLYRVLPPAPTPTPTVARPPRSSAGGR